MLLPYVLVIAKSVYTVNNYLHITVHFFQVTGEYKENGELSSPIPIQHSKLTLRCAPLPSGYQVIRLAFAGEKHIKQHLAVTDEAHMVRGMTALAR